MIDEEVTRTLEQEAIALVNLSTFAAAQKKSGTLEPTASDATSAQAQKTSIELLDDSISMKALLVMLKKRKLQHAELQVTDESSNELGGSDATSEAADDAESAKLPSFRTVFQPPSHQETEGPVPLYIKCKYRTGKCHNMRALKSCGDYHNLCNYHRLRANANQRKLDRKKKEQRLQQQQRTASAQSSPLAPVQPFHASSHAAAAALASLVATHPHRRLNVVQLQRPILTVQEVSAARSTSVRPKEEDACSY